MLHEPEEHTGVGAGVGAWSTEAGTAAMGARAVAEAAGIAGVGIAFEGAGAAGTASALLQMLELLQFLLEQEL